MDYKELVKRLKKYDPRFRVEIGRGKGSHRILFHEDISGEKRSFPVKHHGQKTHQHPKALKEIERRFELPENLLKA